VIPASVTSIGYGPFERATSLTSITVNAGNPNYSSRDNVLYNKSGTDLIQFPAGKTGNSFSVPLGVTTIGEYAFSGATALTSVSIPSTVASIRSAAFASATSLTAINIPEGVTSIESWTFAGATALTSISIPSTVTSIGEGAFNEVASLRSVFLLGNAPTVDGIIQGGMNPQPAAYIRSTATGFGPIGGTWKGLTVAVGVFQVTFDSRGGSAVEAIQSTTGASVNAPSPPQRSGYSFDGWSTSPDGEVVSFPNSPAEDTTLFAKWTKVNNQNSTVVAVPNINDTSQSVAAVDLAARTIRQRTSYNTKSLAKRIGIRIISKKATVNLSVASRSKNICV
jgi:uncharacterized repeat protein (TIGR02543 family)